MTANIAQGLEALATPIDTLRHLEGNPRRGDVDAVARSYDAFGQRKPIVARRNDDGTGEVLAGNHQLAAAKKLGWTHIAVVWVDDDDTTARAFALADNRTAELGGYDDDALAEMVAAVGQADRQLLDNIGYTSDEIASMLELAGVVEVSGSWEEALGALPDGDKGDFETMTLQLHTTQAAQIRNAVDRIWQGTVDTSLNSNRKGAAVAAIVADWLARQGEAS